jgi:hypothetical protein
VQGTNGVVAILSVMKPNGIIYLGPSHCRQISLQLLHLLLLFLQLLLQNLLMVWQSKVGGEIRLDIWKSNIQNGYVIIE